MKQKRPLRTWLIATAVGAVALLGAFLLDQFVYNWVLEHQIPGLTIFMRNVSRFGDWPEHVALGFLLAGVAQLRGNKKWTRIFLSMLIACALAGLASRVLKISTGRARPSVKTEQVWNGPSLSSKYHSFPSGHTTSATAFFGVLFFANRRIGLACLPIPILIAFSRIYLGAHHLSDVVGGALLGVLCAWLVIDFLSRRDPALTETP